MASLVDVYILEDHEKSRELIELNLSLLKTITFRTGACQEDLDRFLREGRKARLYMIDGNYPDKAGGTVSFMAPLEIKKIRELDPQARIVLHSSMPLEQLMREAGKLGVDYRLKGTA